MFDKYITQAKPSNAWRSLSVDIQVILRNESQRVRILSNERDDVIKWTRSGLILASI